MNQSGDGRDGARRPCRHKRDSEGCFETDGRWQERIGEKGESKRAGEGDQEGNGRRWLVLCQRDTDCRLRPAPSPIRRTRKMLIACLVAWCSCKLFA